MLIKCPECNLQVSDSAVMCPHCGYVLNNKKMSNIRRKSNRRKRLPNGFGQITKLKNPNLRKPYRAMVPAGKTNDGKFLSKLLKPNAYFETYNDAYAALVEYHKNPYDIDKDITVKELYDRWSVEYFKHLKSDSAIRNIESPWKYVSMIYNMKVKDVHVRHIKGCIEDAYIMKNDEKNMASPNIKRQIKSIFNLLFDYALEYDLTDTNYARQFNLSKEVRKEVKKNKKDHIDFTPAEIKKLWDNLYKIKYVDVLLIQCYSGWRPQELGLIRMENVDLKNWFIKGGMKTDAGEDRIVPIHPIIRPLIQKRYDEAKSLNSEYLINVVECCKCNSGLKLTYDKYRYRFNNIKKQLKLNPEHRCHDGRVHFTTMMKNADLNEYAIKYIIGHAIEDMTEDVYTRRKPEWLLNEILKIK